MIREAELFVMAEEIMVEVVGRVRAEHWKIVLPPLFVDDRPTPLRGVVARIAREDTSLPDVLGGGTPGEVDLGEVDHNIIRQCAEKACAAARGASDHGEVLLRMTIGRCFAAHDIAMHLGSTACPLTEELARGLWEITDPDAEAWRSRGVFREPLPLPPYVSWRDRFMLCAGRDPHPLHH